MSPNFRAPLGPKDSGHVPVVRALVEASADMNLTDNDGRTALMLAADWGHVEVVRLLVDAGADKDLADKDGRTLGTK